MPTAHRGPGDQYHGIDTEVARRYPATLNDDDILCPDLNAPGTVVTGNNRRRLITVQARVSSGSVVRSVRS